MRESENSPRPAFFLDGKILEVHPESCTLQSMKRLNVRRVELLHPLLRPQSREEVPRLVAEDAVTAVVDEAVLNMPWKLLHSNATIRHLPLIHKILFFNLSIASLYTLEAYSISSLAVVYEP